MIERPTVLILGAGASKDYGFPTAMELTRDVLNDLDEESPLRERIEEAGHEPAKIHSFWMALQDSPLYSVDAFLEHRREFQQVGKAAMAASLMKYEDPEKLRIKVNASADDAGADDWYRYLFSKLVTGGGLEKPEKNKLSIVTFNYDRSFEQWLILHLTNLKQLSEEKIRRFFDKIPIVHVHGKLAELRMLRNDEKDARPFKVNCTVEDIKTCQKLIRIPNDQISLPEFQDAEDLIAAAERICFLGFSFHPDNVRRLNPKKWGGTEIYASGYHLENGEKAEANSLLITQQEIKFASKEARCELALKQLPVFA